MTEAEKIDASDEIGAFILLARRMNLGWLRAIVAAGESPEGKIAFEIAAAGDITKGVFLTNANKSVKLTLFYIEELHKILPLPEKK